MPPSKKTMSKTRQLSALVNFVSCLRSNRTKARTRAFMRWRLNVEAARAVPQVVAGLLPAVAHGGAAVVRRPPRPGLW